MSARVRILPESLTNRIAAGEVVERPASVLKELIENALDAGAQRIDVVLEAGGRRLVRVVDDGHGMSRDDAVLAVERYATSKIADARDLDSGIRTYGFRGEALPSIAAVSRLTLRSREVGREEGTEVRVEGGRLMDARAVGMPTGTEVEAADLFFNTPVRRKFLGSAASELSHSLEWIHRMAMARPEAGFTASHEGRRLLEAAPGESLLARAERIVGEPLESLLTPIDHREGSLRLWGYLSSTELTRSNRRHLYTYVNGRIVNDPLINGALASAYRTLVFPGRHPVAVLFVEIDPEAVDVNVHPTKIQVRFRDGWWVRGQIEGAVRSLLSGAPWLGRPGAPPEPAFSEPADPPALGEAPQPERFQLSAPTGDRPAGVMAALARYYESQPSFEPVPDERPRANLQPLPQFAPRPAQPRLGEEAQGWYGHLTLVGQLLDSFLVCQNAQGLVLIDQHAAQERINFEKIRRRFREADKQIQTLLFPAEFRFGPAGEEALDRHRETLEGLGLVIEPFGEGVHVLKGVPREIAGEPLEPMVRDLMDALARHGSTAPYETVVEDLFAAMACKKSVTARMALSGEEMANLLRELDRFTFATNCPHGRPIFKVITVAELYRLFKR